MYFEVENVTAVSSAKTPSLQTNLTRNIGIILNL